MLPSSRKRAAVALLAACATLLASCADQPTSPVADTGAAARRTIVDATRGGSQEFHWLTPTVGTTPNFIGRFDASALEELSVSVCALDDAGSCDADVESFTSTTLPTPSRISLDASNEAYQLRWLTGASKAKSGERYRISVLRGGALLGTLDVQTVKNTPALASVDTRLYTGIVAGQQFTIRFRVERPDARNYVRINEVESNGGTPGDWAELINTGGQTVDLSGYIFRDNDDSHTYVIPDGTTIAPNGFLVLNEVVAGVGNFDYGLGANEQARLFAPDGSTIVDTYAWTSHAVTTYGRCPDGSGAFRTMTTATKGAANDCRTLIKINEIESSGGVPGDWVELYNAGPAPADLSGYVFRDNNDAAGYVIPNGTIVAPGGYLVLDEVVNGAGNFTFGLGQPDMARLFAPNGVLADSYSWTAHPATTYGRCQNGSGDFAVTGAPTKGTSNNCGSLALAVKINEVESNLGTPGDWVELYNTGSTTADLSGYVFRDNSDAAAYVIPTGTTIAPGAYLVLDELSNGVGNFTFGLGGADQARLFAPDGTTIIDSYTWTSHAATTYGRCPNGVGEFAVTLTSTKGTANSCGASPIFSAWPGEPSILPADIGNSFFGGNMSGLVHEPSGTSAPGVLWAARNGPGTLFRLIASGTSWVADNANGWSNGKALRYPDGTGDVDAEGITLVDGSIYIAAERNNANNGVSRNSILRYDASGVAPLSALNEWNVTADIPANGANLGLEAITWIPDSYLTSRGFRDEATNLPYNPALYANHGTGLFFVGVEATGNIFAYALNHATNGFTRVATIASGFPAVMELQFDRELNQLWAVCDNSCDGRSTILKVDTQVGSATVGRFVLTNRFERPAGMDNLNNEGFAFGAQAECLSGRKPAYWADDSQTSGISIRRGTVTCTPF